MYANMSESDRARALISSDQCIVDEARFFIRGCLEIPVLDSSEVFIWGLWALVKEEVFNEISDSWEEEGRETRRGPFKARLANSLSVYPETLNLRLRIVIQPLGTRPLFILEEEQHQSRALPRTLLGTTSVKADRPGSTAWQWDRLFWVGMSRLWSGWRDALVFVQPDTVVRWHRERFRKFWARLSQVKRDRRGRPAIGAESRFARPPDPLATTVPPCM